LRDVRDSKDFSMFCEAKREKYLRR